MLRWIHLAALITCISVQGTSAQVTVWQETFDGTGNWGTLNQTVGAEGCNANPFYVSCQENGNAAGTCGSACGTNNTLHVSSIVFGDIGAAYDTGGGSGCGAFPSCGFFTLCNCQTNRRSRSGVISTVGYAGIELQFDYIETGSGSVDNALVEYSTNSGSSWTTLLDMPKTNNAGCGGQGRWTNLTIPLPATCENISTLMVAFRWVNNNDLVGTDPSFAVNDVMIVQPVPLPVEMIAFTATSEQRTVRLDWITATEKDNEMFIIERARVDGGFQDVGTIRGMGNSIETVQYNWIDHIPVGGTAFYRLRQVDHNGDWEHSKTVSVSFDQDGPFASWVVTSEHLTAQLAHDVPASWKLFNAQGQLVMSDEFLNGGLRLDLSVIAPGLYVLRSTIAQRVDSRAFIRH